MYPFVHRLKKWEWEAVLASYPGSPNNGRREEGLVSAVVHAQGLPRFSDSRVNCIHPSSLQHHHHSRCNH